VSFLQIYRLGERAVDLEPVGEDLAGLEHGGRDQNRQRAAGRGADHIEQLLPRGLGNSGVEEHHVEILTRQQFPHRHGIAGRVELRNFDWNRGLGRSPAQEFTLRRRLGHDQYFH